MTIEIPTELAGLLPSAPALNRLVYLVGPARSGTSFIHAAMNVHERTLVLPGITYFTQNLWRYRNRVHDRLLRDIMRLPNFWDEMAIQRRLGEERYASFRRLVNDTLARREFASLYQLYPVAYALSPAFAKEPAAIACWHDKHNDWRHLGAIARAFPESKFIFVARDPRSVVLSGARRMARKAGEVAARPKSTELIEMALYWRLLLQRCLDFKARHPNRAIIVRYERFVAEPEQELNRVFTFTIGEPMAAGAIAERLQHVEGGATNTTGERYAGVSREPLARWKTALSRDEIALIEQLTAPTARKLGYDIDRRDGLLGVMRQLRNHRDSSRSMRLPLKALLTELYELQVRATA